MENRIIKPWLEVSSEKIADCKVFTVHKKSSLKLDDLSTHNERTHDFFVFKSGDWVNVIPLTENREVVLIEQYRHGTAGFTLEIPGGMVDPDDQSPRRAAERELLEETGFVSSNWLALGESHPNPAIQGNLCHTFLALSARQKEVPVFSGTEEIAIRLVPLKDIPQLIKNGAITHALVLVAFYWLSLNEDKIDFTP